MFTWFTKCIDFHNSHTVYLVFAKGTYCILQQNTNHIPPYPPQLLNFLLGKIFYDISIIQNSAQ